MPRKYKRRLGAPLRKDYSDESLERALEDVIDRHRSFRQAAIIHGVPRSSLYRKYRGQNIGNLGRPPILSQIEEEKVAKIIMFSAAYGHPFTPLKLRQFVQDFLNRKGVNIPCFEDNLPGKDWLRHFLKRNVELSTRLAENTKRCKAALSEESVNNYFDELEQTVSGIPPENMVNYDETNLPDDPGRERIIAKKGVKHARRTLDSSKSSVSIMIAASASGILLPPYVVYKSKHLYPEWVQGGPTGCRYNRSKTGWFDSIIFEDWFFKIALPYLRHKQGPKLLVGDNLRSHVSQKVIKSCEDNDIRFTFFLPNSTHRCQPLDLSFFRSLKSSWRNVITEWKLRNTGCIPKTVFPSLLLKTLEGLQNIERIIKSGFRAAGIHPLNRQEVLKHFPSAEVDNIRDDALLASFSEIMDNATLVQTNSAAKRSTKILIPAGKSVSSKARNEEEEDIEVESEDDQEEVKEAEDQQNEAESMEDEADDVSSNEEEVQSTSHCKEFDFVIVKFIYNLKTKKEKEKKFIAQVTHISRNKCTVRCMRQTTKRQDMFVFPAVDDINEIDKNDIIQILPEPTIIRGRHIWRKLAL